MCFASQNRSACRGCLRSEPRGLSLRSDKYVYYGSAGCIGSLHPPFAGERRCGHCKCPCVGAVCARSRAGFPHVADDVILTPDKYYGGLNDVLVRHIYRRFISLSIVYHRFVNRYRFVNREPPAGTACLWYGWVLSCMLIFGKKFPFVKIWFPIFKKNLHMSEKSSNFAVDFKT